MPNAKSLELIDTVVIVMMENRSFDHILGSLRHRDFGARAEVDGLTSDGNQKYSNFFEGRAYRPFHTADGTLPHDLPHDRALIAKQIAYSDVTGTYTMRGFVEAYYTETTVTRTSHPEPMGFLAAPELPMTYFLAENFAVCDAWFAPLPTNTQPNRIMFYSGFTTIDETHGALLPDQPLFFEWLTQRGVRWRVYHSGLSNLLAFRHMWDDALGPNFRRFPALARDFQTEAEATFPQVIVVEPEYGDVPVHLGGHPNDNHPPLAAGFGEAFLRTVYEAVTSNPARWARTLMIVVYDEHGGFFDHVPPLAIATPDPNGIYPAFASTGVRVPALVVSPLVEPRSVYHGNLDHTSMLQLLAEKFAPETAGYSDAVNARRDGDPAITSVSAALNRPAPRADIPRAPAGAIRVVADLLTVDESVTPNQRMFVATIEALLAERPDAAVQKYAEISHWNGVP
jgi:phospholipase C